MSIKATWGLTVLLAASALAGCAQSQPTIRGQSPAVAPGVAPTAAPGVACETQGPIIGSAPGYAEQTHAYKAAHTHQDFLLYTGFRDNNFGYEGGYFYGPETGYYAQRGHKYQAAGNAGGCPACEYGGACPQGGCQHCGMGCPRHYQTYRYNWPQNMVYPPNQVPAGVVQYPYYSNRGPTDFFMK